MKYVEYLNNLINVETAKPEHVVLFGQNINAGSCLAGLTRNLAVQPSGRVINSTNAENSLVGFGFGLMMGGVHGVFFMKQMDFLLLGTDHLVNTYNIIRSVRHQLKDGSFTIVAVVVDSGYEGPQSALNNFADFCSVARIPGFTITNKVDADFIFARHFLQPGFRIIGVSQRLERADIIDPGEQISTVGDGEIFQYSEGEGATLVSFNFSFPQVLKLRASLAARGVPTSHFNVNSPVAVDWTAIKESVSRTGKIVVVDDSKSGHVAADALMAEFAGIPLTKKIVVKRKLGEDWLHPVSDLFEINEERVIDELKP